MSYPRARRLRHTGTDYPSVKFARRVLHPFRNQRVYFVVKPTADVYLLLERITANSADLRDIEVCAVYRGLYKDPSKPCPFRAILSNIQLRKTGDDSFANSFRLSSYLKVPLTDMTGVGFVNLLQANIEKDFGAAIINQ